VAGLCYAAPHEQVGQQVARFDGADTLERDAAHRPGCQQRERAGGSGLHAPRTSAMKMPTRKARRHNIIVTRKRTARRASAKRRRVKLRLNLLRMHSRYEWIKAPEQFSIETQGQCTELVEFIARLRRAALSPTSLVVRIDFSRTVRMTAAGTLLFAAELDRINALRSGRVTCTWPTSDRVAQVLLHVGIFEKLGQVRQCKITAKDVKYWKVDSGGEVRGELAAEAMQRYRYLFPDEKQTLYRGITEAMTNTRQHAYEGERGDGFGNVLPNWWMFSEYREQRLIVAVCDLGIGIPRSLPKDKSGLWPKIVLFLTDEHLLDEDANRIRAAIAVGTSRTNAEYRGKGLMEIRSVLDGLSGKINIYSNCGIYRYDAATQKETCLTFPPATSIHGTIVLWNIPVEQRSGS
jgi:hypothetical protein